MCTEEVPNTPDALYSPAHSSRRRLAHPVKLSGAPQEIQVIRVSASAQERATIVGCGAGGFTIAQINQLASPLARKDTAPMRNVKQFRKMRMRKMRNMRKIRT